MSTPIECPELSQEQWEFVAHNNSVAQAKAWVTMFTEHRFKELRELVVANNDCKTTMWRWFQHTIVFLFDEHYDIANEWIEQIICTDTSEPELEISKSYLATALSRALDKLDDAEKACLLKGESQQPSHQKLYVLISNTAWLLMACPSWFGRHGSALREAAILRNVQPFPDMLHIELLRKTRVTGKLFAYHPYAYSGIVLGKIREHLAARKAPQQSKNVTMDAKARTQDIYLALCFQDLSPVPLDIRLVADTQTVPISKEEYERIRQQAVLHMQMFSLNDLIEQMDRGVFPCVQGGSSLALPTLDGD